MQNARRDNERPEDAAAETQDAEAREAEAAESAKADAELAAQREAAAAGDPTGEAAEAASADDRLTALEKQLAETREHMLRAVAEAENTRRRAAREKDEAVKYAAAGFARDILQIADNLDRALAAVSEELKHSSDEARTVIEGVEMTRRELVNTFERHGIARIEALGEPFDAERHQAMYEVETEEHPPGHVAQEMVPGYLLKDRLLRPAMVGVAKQPQNGGSGGRQGEKTADSGGDKDEKSD
jgi:molecular chaperone GrpE